MSYLNDLLFEIEENFIICKSILKDPSSYDHNTRERWNYAIFDLLTCQRALRDFLNENDWDD